MPRVIDLSALTPANVSQATAGFGSELRANLIRHYREHPGTQRSAAHALGVAPQAVSHNTRVLVDCGIVLVETAPNSRAQICRVDPVRLQELLDALSGFVAAT